jgi:IS5 family transposase
LLLESFDNQKYFKMSISHQTELVTLEDLVPVDHIYRKFKDLWDFSFLDTELSLLDTSKTYKGFGSFRLFMCLLLQFMEDLSDRELDSFMQGNNHAKWFCGFGLVEKTPNFRIFSTARKRIGTKNLFAIFNNLRSQLKSQGYMNEVFTFVDASHLISKASLWEERDEAIKQKYEKLNNEVLPKFAKDKQARFGCKGGQKYWYGYKKHISVDMQSGMINKVSITDASIIDSKGMKHVVPDQGAVYGDKGYCDINAKKAASKRGLHLAAVKKHNMKGKNKELDKFYTKMRSPYERVFSKTNHRVRYHGISKNQFTAFMESIVHNLKRMVVLNQEAPPNIILE